MTRKVSSLRGQDALLRRYKQLKNEVYTGSKGKISATLKISMNEGRIVKFLTYPDTTYQALGRTSRARKGRSRQNYYVKILGI